MIFKLLKSSIINIWPTLAIASVTFIAIRLVYMSNHHAEVKLYKDFWKYLGIIYMCLLYELVTRVDINGFSGTNLIPFKEILRYDLSSRMFYVTVFGNIALFIPFGFIVAYYCKPKKFWQNALVAIIVSSTIEYVQLKIGRCFDIDDIILNAVGCVIGYYIYKLFKKIYHKLPAFFKGKFFNNLLCVVIIIVIGFFVFKMLGIKV